MDVSATLNMTGNGTTEGRGVILSETKNPWVGWVFHKNYLLKS